MTQATADVQLINGLDPTKDWRVKAPNSEYTGTAGKLTFGNGSALWEAGDAEAYIRPTNKPDKDRETMAERDRRLRLEYLLQAGFTVEERN